MTTNLPLVSVLIRSVGRPTLAEALQSVSLQSYSNIEVIVVNAKGENHPPVGDLCGKFTIKLVGDGKSKSRTQAANMALEQAEGEYLIFLDDDDLFDSDHIEELEKTLTSSKTLVAYSGVRCTNRDSTETIQVNNAEYDPIRMLIGNYIPIHAILFSRELLDKGCRFDESIELYEDWDFWIQLSQHTEFVHLDKITASYRIINGAGYGVNAKPDSVEKARIQILNKWRIKWTDRQLLELTELVDRKRLLELKINQLRETSKATKGELETAKDELETTKGELETTKGELDIINIEREDLYKMIRNKEEELKSLINSRSWRITRPLRALWRILK